ncbi:hypothetical protein EJ02DRAFT_451323 [Clathrospora elynae]|uniref:Uncharacterized protein n=1 Tax=Clathrospora elynae TaxID=706981 RepID=A0A6A5SZ93_9PLEO|nr:hypothetical protein EJ02DRAFT_451323 [Clathrospora elynae]
MNLMVKVAKLEGIAVGSKADFEDMNRHVNGKRVKFDSMLDQVFSFRDSKLFRPRSPTKVRHQRVASSFNELRREQHKRPRSLRCGALAWMTHVVVRTRALLRGIVKLIP